MEATTGSGRPCHCAGEPDDDDSGCNGSTEGLCGRERERDLQLQLDRN